MRTYRTRRGSSGVNTIYYLNDLLKIICLILAASAILIGGARAVLSVSGLYGTGYAGAGCEAAAAEEAEPADWRLILVNGSHPVPDNYEITFTELSNGQKVDKRIYPDLQNMFDDARAEGFSLTVREGYRTHSEQTEIMEKKILEYKNQGFSQAESKLKAAELVAQPGTSEHELGLAVDINAAGDTDQWELYGWLAQNAHKYGFILRYPQGREDITGITYEPWHYRFVGKEAAAEIYERQITLEEYLGA